MLTKHRMEAAVRLFQKSGLAISEIALAVGYADLLYFSSIFKNYGIYKSLSSERLLCYQYLTQSGFI